MEVKDKYVRYMVFKLADHKDISVERISEILNIPREEARKFWFNYFDNEENSEMSYTFMRESNKRDRLKGVQQNVEGQAWKA
ncbi:MAG TPA: hypothetical protein PLA54_11735 [Spirochaetota bacterium]|nr:hypothetical protein [Spirochaetota bacterium]